MHKNVGEAKGQVIVKQAETRQDSISKHETVRNQGS